MAHRRTPDPEDAALGRLTEITHSMCVEFANVADNATAARSAAEEFSKAVNASEVVLEDFYSWQAKVWRPNSVVRKMLDLSADIVAW